ncbi:hypothetical protein FT663_05528, partial [Candidozyma haemuli var. vulneris]
MTPISFTTVPKNLLGYNIFDGGSSASQSVSLDFAGFVSHEANGPKVDIEIGIDEARVPRSPPVDRPVIFFNHPGKLDYFLHTFRPMAVGPTVPVYAVVVRATQWGTHQLHSGPHAINVPGEFVNFLSPYPKANFFDPLLSGPVVDPVLFQYMARYGPPPPPPQQQPQYAQYA